MIMISGLWRVYRCESSFCYEVLVLPHLYVASFFYVLPEENPDLPESRQAECF